MASQLRNLRRHLLGEARRSAKTGADGSSTGSEPIKPVQAATDAGGRVFQLGGIARPLLSNGEGHGIGGTRVGINVGNPTNILTVLYGGGHAIADGWDTYSSRRWKSDIHALHGALGKVEQLRGVSHTHTASHHDIGMIAEEVGKVVPEVVTYEDNGKDARGIDSPASRRY